VALEECSKHQHGCAKSFLGHHHCPRHKALIFRGLGPVEHNAGRAFAISGDQQHTGAGVQ
jgi:hypothetical protein